MRREFNLAELWRSSEPMMSLRDTRHSVFLKATVAAGGADPAPARVRNISRGGLMAECRIQGSEGDRVEVSLRGFGEIAGSIAWASRGRIGVMLDEQIEPEIMLRRPARRDTVGCVPRPAVRPWRPALHAS